MTTPRREDRDAALLAITQAASARKRGRTHWKSPRTVDRGTWFGPGKRFALGWVKCSEDRIYYYARIFGRTYRWGGGERFAKIDGAVFRAVTAHRRLTAPLIPPDGWDGRVAEPYGSDHKGNPLWRRMVWQVRKERRTNAGGAPKSFCGTRGWEYPALRLVQDWRRQVFRLIPDFSGNVYIEEVSSEPA